MDLNEHVLRLTFDALTDIENAHVPLSAIRRSIRISRLRNDFDNLWWLEMEMCDSKDLNKTHILKEIIPHYTNERYLELKKYYSIEWINERRVPIEDLDASDKDDKFLSMGVA